MYLGAPTVTDVSCTRPQIAHSFFRKSYRALHLFLDRGQYHRDLSVPRPVHGASCRPVVFSPRPSIQPANRPTSPPASRTTVDPRTRVCFARIVPGAREYVGSRSKRRGRHGCGCRGPRRRPRREPADGLHGARGEESGGAFARVSQRRAGHRARAARGGHAVVCITQVCQVGGRAATGFSVRFEYAAACIVGRRGIQWREGSGGESAAGDPGGAGPGWWPASRAEWAA